MGDPTKLIVQAVRLWMARFARWLNAVTNGAVLPVHITILSLLGHFSVVWALWDSRPVLAAGLLTGFGLLDALDGALAREQGTASKLGMLFDAVTDRLKETLVYVGLIVYAGNHVSEVRPWVIVAVAGTSLLVSYVKAKSEMAVADSHADRQKLNQMFSIGLARYEIRTTIVVVGLLMPVLLAPLLHFTIAINLMTAALRFLQAAEVLQKENSEESSDSQNTTKTLPQRTATSRKQKKDKKK